jgi:hypothetical protein
VEQVNKNESMRTDFPWGEALFGGPQSPYQIEENGPLLDGKRALYQAKAAFLLIISDCSYSFQLSFSSLLMISQKIPRSYLGKIFSNYNLKFIIFGYSKI